MLPKEPGVADRLVEVRLEEPAPPVELAEELDSLLSSLSLESPLLPDPLDDDELLECLPFFFFLDVSFLAFLTFLPGTPPWLKSKDTPLPTGPVGTAAPARAEPGTG